MLRPAPAYGEKGTEEAIDAHFSYLQSLHEAGEVHMAGRFSDVLIGFVMVSVDSGDRAREIMNSDPAVKAGVFHAELYQWRIALQ
ncbi:MAG: hypothetical protein EAX95_14010 [Candidatus Thorarchaeota archaeon]|nr:hypothetical protein [Candidatus Thorarchaeota archaeon]